ncbi:hypothetical protein PoB_005254600 [Plakobranchus ocellatus]|uniref:Uncharacterized protein n=1 Tax=Plakobranchus ocellatus TaxID=259542 RepID=A0AAV4C3R8_9GAST|nr:hypothetical protein PoB_005254600 [Plakobranchus ocellatus]
MLWKKNCKMMTSPLMKKEKKTNGETEFDTQRDAERKKKPEEVSNFIAGLPQIAPGCAFFPGSASQLRTRKSQDMPPTLQQLADKCLASNSIQDEGALSQTFGEILLLKNEQCDILKWRSLEQGTSSVWLEQRKGRIMGSNVRRVARKIVKLMRNKKAASTTIMTCSREVSHIPARYQGKENELKGLMEFKEAMRVSHHNMSVTAIHRYQP